MALYDSAIRFGNKINPKIALTENYEETLEDVYKIAMTFKEIIGSPSKFLGN